MLCKLYVITLYIITLYVIMYIATCIVPGVCICGIIDDDLFVSLIICWLKDWPNQIHAIYNYYILSIGCSDTTNVKFHQ